MFQGLTKEHSMIKSMAREFARKVLSETASDRDKNKEFPFDNLKKMANLGLLGMMVPLEYNGSGSDTIEYVIALSEIAYACASTAVVMSVHNSIVNQSILNFGTKIQKEKYLKNLASGKYIGAFALTEPQAGSDVIGQETFAKKCDGYYLINGSKRFITSAKNCGLILLSAKTNFDSGYDAISIFIVDRNNPGIIIGPNEDKMGLRASDTCDIVFKDCKISFNDILGKEGDGFKIAMSALNSGRIGIAAQSIGVAKAALDQSVKYMKTRKQFGKYISSFQGLRWMISEMATQIEAAKQLTFSAALMKDRGEDYTKQASMAKLFSSEMVNMVTTKAIQIHGGYGFITDYPLERFYRDSKVFTIYEGTSEIQKVIIANEIFKDKKK